jgi:Ca-activated chloride channel family protein
MVVIDTSLSMSAHDINPSRIQRVKLELLDLVQQMDHTRLGLVVYAGRPHLLTPPTADKQALRHYINTLRSGLLPTEGSSLFEALQFSVQFFAKQPASQSTVLPRGILIVSDGEVNLTALQQQASITALASSLKQHNLRLYALGIGTTQGAPLLTEQAGWLKHKNQGIVSRLNRDLLTKLTNIGNGQYSSSSEDNSDWHTLYTNGIAQLAFQERTRDETEQILWQEKYHAYAVAGFVFLLLGVWLPSLDKLKLHSTTTVWLTTIGLVLSVTHSLPAQAANQTDYYKIGYEQFQQGDYQAAKTAFARVPGYRGRLAEGNMAYQLQDYQLAIPQYIQATLDANSDQQRIQAIFNLANCYYRLARYTEAERLYRDVLRYQQDFTPARINLDYAVALQEQQHDSERVTAPRQGKGPRLADAPDEMDITSGKVSLGDSETKQDITHIDQLNRHSAAEVPMVLEQSSLASEKVERRKDEAWSYEITSLQELQQRNLKIQSNESDLWQRMFEIEEDFEATLKQPKTLPGIKPW